MISECVLPPRMQARPFPSNAPGAGVAIKLPCNHMVQLTVAVATERDAKQDVRTAPATGPDSALALATANTDVKPGTEAFTLRNETSQWWSEWWSKSSVNLGAEFIDLQRWYTTAMFLLRGATAEGKVAPGLWG